MSTEQFPENPDAAVADDVDRDRIAAWLSEVFTAATTVDGINKLDGGHSSGAWRLSLSVDGVPRSVVLKAPGFPSVVHGRDAGQEARIVRALHEQKVPVPEILAIDHGATVVGRPCFVMDHIDGRSVADSGMGGPHDDGWFRDSSPTAQRAVWHGFHDALAAMHRAEVSDLSDASHGPNGSIDTLGYWRASLLDAVEPAAVPRQLALLDWLTANLPPDADVDPALCMGDARLVNALFRGGELQALIDFEVAYRGNPLADIGYSLFFNAMQRENADQAIDGLPTDDETWQRWSDATGRPIANRDYWTAFGATIVAITATRAMVQWGLGGPNLESDNVLIDRWEAAAERAGR